MKQLLIFILPLLFASCVKHLDNSPRVASATGDSPGYTRPFRVESWIESDLDFQRYEGMGALCRETSGTASADLVIGPFEEDTRVFVEAKNTVKAAESEGDVSLAVITDADSESPAETLTANNHGKDEISCRTGAVLTFFSGRTARFVAKGDNQNATPQAVYMKAYVLPPR